MARNRMRSRRTRRPRARVARAPYFVGGKKYSKPWAKRTKRGFLSIMRKTKLITIGNASSGTPILTDPTGTCVTMGTATLSPGFGAGVYDIPFSMKFQVNQLIQSSDITALADQYKLLAAYVRVFYNINQSTGSPTDSLSSMPFIQWITDHDDAAVPDITNIRAKMGLKFRTFKNNSGYIGLTARPKPAMEVYSSGTSGSYVVPGRSPWINSTDDDVPHYAIKGILCQVPLPDVANGQVVFTFDVAQRVLAKDFQ